MGAAPFPCPRASVPHARARVAAPPPAWYTGAGHPADGRRPHARRAAFLHERGHTSPLELVSSSCTRAGEVSRRAGHGSHGPKDMYFGQQKSRPPEWCKHSSERPDHAPVRGVNGRYTIVTELAPSVASSYHDFCRVSSPSLHFPARTTRAICPLAAAGRRAAARQTPRPAGARNAAPRGPRSGPRAPAGGAATEAPKDSASPAAGGARPERARAPSKRSAAGARGPARSPQRTGGARRASTGAPQRAKAGGKPPARERRASAAEDGNARAGARPRPRGSRPQSRKNADRQRRAAASQPLYDRRRAPGRAEREAERRRRARTATTGRPSRPAARGPAGSRPPFPETGKLGFMPGNHHPARLHPIVGLARLRVP